MNLKLLIISRNKSNPLTFWENTNIKFTRENKQVSAQQASNQETRYFHYPYY